jgi:hypothetical protein
MQDEASVGGKKDERGADVDDVLLKPKWSSSKRVCTSQHSIRPHPVAAYLSLR